MAGAGCAAAVRLKPDSWYRTTMSCVVVRLQPDPTSEIERSDRRHDVERERDDLRPLQAEGRHEREIGQEAADRRPCRVGSVQQGDPPSAGM